MRWVYFFLCLSLTTPVWAGASLSSDATNDSVIFGDINSLDDETNLSAGCWVFQNDLLADYQGIDKQAAVGFWILIFDDVGAVSGRTDIYTIAIQETVAPNTTARVEGASSSGLASTWQWIAFTFDNLSTTGLRLYIDGSEDANSPASTASIDDSGGGSTSTVNTMEGTLGGRDRNGNEAHCQAWQRTITAVEVQEARWKPGLVPLNLQLFAPHFGNASPEPDLSGNGNTGTITGAAESFSGPPVMFGDGLPL